MAAMQIYKKRFPLMTVLIIAFFCAIMRFTILYTATAIIKISFDIIIIGFAFVVCYNIMGMVRELNYVIMGTFLIAIGQLIIDWPFYLESSISPETMTLSTIIRYLFNFFGFGLMFYGFVKFYEKYKFD
jgi:hypothetical protein